ncbi:MAG: PEP-CTERM sorting domain-containing protein [Planctomycetota bacterium]
MMNIKPTPIALAIGLIALSGTAQGAIIGSTTDTFTGGGAVPSVYTDFNPGNQSTTLEVSTDGANLDGADDGYLRIQRTAATSASIGVNRALGTVEASDIGSVVTIDVAYGRPNSSGWTLEFDLELDGDEVGGDADFAVNIFSSGNDPSAATGLLSAVKGSAFTYTIQAGDVGKALSFEMNLFDSSSTANRIPHIDAVQITVTPIPEPGSIGLTACGLGLLLARKRRKP